MEITAIVCMRWKASPMQKLTKDWAVFTMSCRWFISIPCFIFYKKRIKHNEKHVVRRTSYEKGLEWKYSYIQTYRLFEKLHTICLYWI